MNQRVFYTLNLAVFIGMLGVGLVIPFMPIYAKTLGATTLSIGVFFASFPLAQLCFMPTISRLSDRHGRKWFISAGLLLCSLLSLWFVYAPTMLYLIIGRFVQGGTMALILPIATAYVGDLAPPNKRGTYMGIFNLFLTSSFGMGPLLGGESQRSLWHRSRLLFDGRTECGGARGRAAISARSASVPARARPSGLLWRDVAQT